MGNATLTSVYLIELLHWKIKKDCIFITLNKNLVLFQKKSYYYV